MVVIVPMRRHTGGDPREDSEIFEHYRDLIDDWDAFQAAIRRPLPNCIWANTLRTTPDELRGSLGAEGIELQPIDWCPGAFRLPDGVAPGRPWQYRAGLYHVQEEASLVPVSCTSIAPGDRILDLCAAPGNKTAQLSLAVGETGTVVANDRSGERTRAVRHAIERLGLVNVAVTVWDGKRFPMPQPLFDGVLVDAPCSCEGTVRKSPREARRVEAREIESIAVVQTILLRRAVKLVRPGGWVIYSTCTFSPHENEGVVDAVLGHRRSEVTLEPIDLPGFRASPGVTEWQGRAFAPGMERCLRVWPHTNDTGGFFVALLRRSGGAENAALGDANEEHSPRIDVPRTPLADDPHLGPALDRFGIAREVLEGWISPTAVGGKVYAAPSTYHPPPEPAADSHGLLALHTKMRFPKLTTAAAMRWGVAATRNRVPLDAEQREGFFAREKVWLREDQACEVSGLGYVIVFHQGCPLGIGFFEREAGRPRVSSMYPRGWVM